MRKNNQRKSNFVKNLAAAVCIIGVGSLAFQGIAQVALGMESGKKETVSTSYSTNVAVMGNMKDQALPEGYVKPEYQLVDSNLEYYRDKKPTSADITREEAAELGVQAFYSIFGLDMNGKTIEMTYDPAQGERRATWSGFWWPDGLKSSPEADVRCYYFCLDAVTGELKCVLNGRVLDESTDIGFDSGLEQNSEDYESLAKEMAVNLGAIKGSVNKVEYAGQGKSGNDPFIMFDLTGEGGDRARLRFSRYDKEMIGVTFDAGMKDFEIADKEAEEAAKRAAEYFEQHPEAEFYEEY